MTRTLGQTRLFSWILASITFALCVEVHAQALTPAQLSTLKSNIAASSDTVQAGTSDCGAFVGTAVNAVPNTSDGNVCLARVYNLVATPDFWVWRTAVTKLEIVSTTSVDATIWSWPDYIARSQAERDGWREMFADGAVNASLSNVRQGFADIFSGASGAAQRTHLLAVGRRKATRAEKLFATGTGSMASPAIMAVEGALTGTDILNARSQ